VHCTFQIIIWH
jgi:hypothetical protein